MSYFGVTGKSAEKSGHKIAKADHACVMTAPDFCAAARVCGRILPPARFAPARSGPSRKAASSCLAIA
jgi:hypothetical protein